MKDDKNPFGRSTGYAGDAYYGNDGVVYDEDLHVPCPAHTTERKLITKIDIRVIPVLCVLYLLAFLDRVNISNARSFSLEEDLGMNPKSLQFSTAVGQMACISEVVLISIDCYILRPLYSL